MRRHRACPVWLLLLLLLLLLLRTLLELIHNLQIQRNVIYKYYIAWQRSR